MHTDAVSRDYILIEAEMMLTDGPRVLDQDIVLRLETISRTGDEKERQKASELLCRAA